jgi:hypothetical protein
MVSPWLCPGGWDIRASCVTQWGSQHRMYTVITVSTSFVTFLKQNKKNHTKTDIIMEIMKLCETKPLQMNFKI